MTRHAIPRRRWIDVRQGLRLVSVTALFASLSLLPGCKDERPTVSLDQAREITTSFRATAFEPPPRRASDIIGLFDRSSAKDERFLARNRALADSKPLGDADPVARARFYAARARAADLLARMIAMA